MNQNFCLRQTLTKQLLKHGLYTVLLLVNQSSFDTEFELVHHITDNVIISSVTRPRHIS